ncbi:MAG: hypothetical protein VKN13_01230 [Cyanobacteriota bacterium]|nr:hypothetical protein [Cyanobacteriota bacterium]
MALFPCMREIVFRVLSDTPGHLEAEAADRAIRIAAPSLEELHHEAREALIAHLGPAHAAYRVRIRRTAGPAMSTIRPLRRPPASCL